MHRRQALAGLAAAVALPGCSLLDDGGGGGRAPIANWLVAPKPNHVPMDYSATAFAPRRRAKLYRELDMPEREVYSVPELRTELPIDAVDASAGFQTRTNDRVNGYRVVLGSFDEGSILESIDREPVASHGPFEIRASGTGNSIATSDGQIVIMPGLNPVEDSGDVKYVLDTGLGNRERYVDRFPDADRLLSTLPTGYELSMQVGEEGTSPIYDVGYTGSSSYLDGDLLGETHVAVMSDGEAPNDEYRQEYVEELAGDDWTVVEDSFGDGVLTVELERPLEDLTAD